MKQKINSHFENEEAKSLVVKNEKCQMDAKKFDNDGDKLIQNNDPFVMWLEKEIKNQLDVTEKDNVKPISNEIKNIKNDLSIVVKCEENNETVTSTIDSISDKTKNNKVKMIDNTVCQIPTALTWFVDEIKGHLVNKINSNTYIKPKMLTTQEEESWAYLSKKNKKERKKNNNSKQSVMSDLGSVSDLDMGSDNFNLTSHLMTAKKVLAGYLVTLDRKYELYNGVNIIGKTNSGNVKITDESNNCISKEHAIIYISDNIGWYLKHQSYHNDTILFRVNVFGKHRTAYEEKLKVGDWYLLPEKCTVIFGKCPAIIFGERIAHLLLPTIPVELQLLHDKLNENNKLEITNSSNDSSNKSKQDNIIDINSNDSQSIKLDDSCHDDLKILIDKRKIFESNKENKSEELFKKRIKAKRIYLRGNNSQFGSSSSLNDNQNQVMTNE